MNLHKLYSRNNHQTWLTWQQLCKRQQQHQPRDPERRQRWIL